MAQLDLEESSDVAGYMLDLGQRARAAARAAAAADSGVKNRALLNIATAIADSGMSYGAKTPLTSRPGVPMALMRHCWIALS